MKKALLFLIPLLIISLVISYPQNINGKINGSPGGKTNSPGDGNNNCTGCHNANINSGPGDISITSNIPSSGYIPGETYTITTNITENGSNIFGFEITSEGGNGFSPKIGTWIITNSSTTKYVNSDAAVTHTSSGISGSNTTSWSIDWTAPSWGSSTGTITFYAAGVAANGNGNNSGDNVYTVEYSVNEQSSSSIYNNHTNNLNISYLDNVITLTNNNELINVSFYNINGKLIKSLSKNIPRHINTSAFSKGTYIIKTIDILNNQYSQNINIY